VRNGVSRQRLVSPECISSCDRQALLFKSSKRAFILGTESNGTGAGYRTSESFVSTEWKDANDIFSINIPNALWGTPGEVGKREFREDGAYFRYNSENLPTKADIRYDATVADYLQNSTGWFDAAINAFELQSVRPTRRN
jgi:hypothetical protein